MSVIYCHDCDQYIDSDYVECVADPRDDTEMMCLECLVTLEGELEADIEFLSSIEDRSLLQEKDLQESMQILSTCREY